MKTINAGFDMNDDVSDVQTLASEQAGLFGFSDNTQLGNMIGTTAIMSATACAVTGTFMLGAKLVGAMLDDPKKRAAEQSKAMTEALVLGINESGIIEKLQSTIVMPHGMHAPVNSEEQMAAVIKALPELVKVGEQFVDSTMKRLVSTVGEIKTEVDLGQMLVDMARTLEAARDEDVAAKAKALKKVQADAPAIIPAG